MEYVLEVIRAEGTSEWRTCAHDEFALVMDGEVEFRLRQARRCLVGPRRQSRGSVALSGEPTGPRGWAASGPPRAHDAAARRGRLPVQGRPAGVILLQTIAGDDTVYKWAEICQTIPLSRRLEPTTKHGGVSAMAIETAPASR